MLLGYAPPISKYWPDLLGRGPRFDKASDGPPLTLPKRQKPCVALDQPRQVDLHCGIKGLDQTGPRCAGHRSGGSRRHAVRAFRFAPSCSRCVVPGWPQGSRSLLNNLPGFRGRLLHATPKEITVPPAADIPQRRIRGVGERGASSGGPLRRCAQRHVKRTLRPAASSQTP